MIGQVMWMLDSDKFDQKHKKVQIDLKAEKKDWNEIVSNVTLNKLMNMKCESFNLD